LRYTGEQDLPKVTEQAFRDALRTARPYTALVLKATPSYEAPGPNRSRKVEAIVLDHAMRNLALFRARLLRVVCPIADGSGVTGIGIFDATPEDVERIMREDPGVKAGIFTFDIHPTGTFPDSSLAVTEGAPPT
jgi:hypothetical protein